MQGVDVAVEVAEREGDQSLAVVEFAADLRDTSKDIGGGAFDVADSAEAVLAFGDVDGANLAGPVIDVLKM